MYDKQPPLLSVNVRLSHTDFELSVEQDLTLDGITGLFGPSGAGKSTLLRVIAGLERSAAGKVSFIGECWLDSSQSLFVPAYRRPVGYVFQDARLFEHLTVAGNLKYAAQRRAAEQLAIRYEEVVSTFDLPSLLSRTTDSLSGGERQRVAIARTLLTQPRLLLLDEPLAALDIGRKSEILPYLEKLSSRFGIPTIYVSHAIDEMTRLADHVVVLEHGKVLASGKATDVLNQLNVQSPTSLFEAVTVLDTTVVEQQTDLELMRLDHHGQTIVVPARRNVSVGQNVRLHIRAGDVAIATQKPEAISFRNILSGSVSGIDDDPESAFAIVTIDIAGAKLRAELTRQAIQDLGLANGLPVFALLKTASFDSRF